jgi:hypothetical protein
MIKMRNKMRKLLSKTCPNPISEIFKNGYGKYEEKLPLTKTKMRYITGYNNQMSKSRIPILFFAE